MVQLIPAVSGADIHRIIARDFSQSNFDEILSILNMYHAEAKELESRVYASVLKLSCADKDQLKAYVENANVDYRDVLAWAEYPNYFNAGFNSLTDEESERLIEMDRIQYQEWFEKA